MAAASAISAASTGCSITYHSLYEADARFEHCYRLDEEKHVSVPEKQRCWHDWNQKHAVGQSRDRVEYALARERALGQPQASGDPMAPRGFIFPNGVVWAPQPLNAFAPPPQLMTRDAGGPDVERTPAMASLVDHPVGVLAPTPGATCGVACGKAWGHCGEACKGKPCQSECDDRYRVCMRACF